MVLVFLDEDIQILHEFSEVSSLTFHIIKYFESKADVLQLHVGIQSHMLDKILNFWEVVAAVSK